MVPLKPVCHLTRLQSMTPSASQAVLSIDTAMPWGVSPIWTTSSELTTGTPIDSSVMP